MQTNRIDFYLFPLLSILLPPLFLFYYFCRKAYILNSLLESDSAEILHSRKGTSKAVIAEIQLTNVTTVRLHKRFSLGLDNPRPQRQD